MTTLLRDVDGQPMTIRRGTSPTFVFNVTEAGTTTPKNLNGATEVSLAIGLSRHARARDLLLTLGDGISHDGPGGTVTAALTAVQTEALPTGTRWAQLWITDFEGRRDVPGEGECVIYDSLVSVPP
jgi:hypothetical protein